MAMAIVTVESVWPVCAKTTNRAIVNRAIRVTMKIVPTMFVVDKNMCLIAPMFAVPAGHCPLVNGVPNQLVHHADMT